MKMFCTRFKRIFDLIFSFGAIILLLPLFAFIALLIKTTSRGPLLFVQERVGKDGRPFMCYKFRSMFVDAEKRLQKILKKDSALKEEWEQKYKLSCDPRITPVGKLLRKTSLDELPQFFNVLFGDMSVVGPRPVVREEIVKYYKKEAAIILSVRPGITGLWQVSGRTNTSYSERIALDKQYVCCYSLGNDFKIIARTVMAVLSGKGAC